MDSSRLCVISTNYKRTVRLRFSDDSSEGFGQVVRNLRTTCTKKKTGVFFLVFFWYNRKKSILVMNISKLLLIFVS